MELVSEKWSDERIEEKVRFWFGDGFAVPTVEKLLKEMRDDMEQMQGAVGRLYGERNNLQLRIAELERELASLRGDDWGKTVDYLMAHAPEPEPTYDVPEPPEGWEDED